MVLAKKDLSKAFSPRSRRVVSKQGRGPPPHLGLSMCSSASKTSPRRRPPLSTGKAPSSANVRVLVRVRPPSRREIENKSRQIIKVVDENMLIFDPKEENQSFFFHGSKQRGRDMVKKPNKNIQYLFDRVFGFDSNNEQVFDGSTRPVITSVLDGYNCSVFVYGATGAGKTYTMLGTKENPGITFRTMVELFQQMDAQKSEKEFDIGVSYLEVYNENVQDLICPSGPLHLRDDASGGVVVAGLKMERISDPDRMFELLEEGNKNRTQHPTDANAESSRSHAVFQVFLKMTTKATGQTKIVKLSMIDLAGSERGAATGCVGARFKEGSNINKSLLALGNCINALADGLRHVPYRDSKLTRLLKDSLGGNCQTVMIANVSPAAATAEDTQNTLKYATRAKKIKSKIKRNIVSVELHVSNYVKMVEDLQAENAKLKEELRKLKSSLEVKSASDPINSDVKQNSNKITLPPTVAAATAAIINCQSAAQPVSICSIGVGTSPSKENVLNAELNRFVQEAQLLFAAKEKLQERYLNMDSEEKRLKWRIEGKQRAANRVQKMTTTPMRMEEAQTRVDRSLVQFNGRLISANECQETLSRERSEIDHKLSCLKIRVEQSGLTKEFNKHLENMELKFTQQELRMQCQHLEKLFALQEREREQQDAVLSEASAAFRYYYSLLRGHGHMTATMMEEYQTLIRHLEGVKNVKWEDNDGQTVPQLINSKSVHNVTKLSFSVPFSQSTRPSLESTGGLLPQQSPTAATTVEGITDEPIGLVRRLKSPPPPRMPSPVRRGSPVNALQLTDNISDSILQSPLKVEIPTVLENMDDATMLTSLGKLDNMIDDILNTSVPPSAVDDYELDVATTNVDSATPHFNGTFAKSTESPLNVTYEAGDNLNATFNKEDLNNTYDNPDTLNRTFDKTEGLVTSVLNGSYVAADPLNDGFSVVASPVKALQFQASPVSGANSPSGESRRFSLLKTPRKVAIKQLMNANALAAASSSPVGPSAVSVTASTSAPSVKTGVVTKKQNTVGIKNDGNRSRDKCNPKVLLSNQQSRSASSAKLHGVNRKIVGAATKMVTTPSKIKKAWNKDKENRNTATHGSGSVTFVKPAPSTKNAVNAWKSVTAKVRNPVNGTVPKGSSNVLVHIPIHFHQRIVKYLDNKMQ